MAAPYIVAANTAADFDVCYSLCSTVCLQSEPVYEYHLKLNLLLIIVAISNCNCILHIVIGSFSYVVWFLQRN